MSSVLALVAITVASTPTLATGCLGPNNGSNGSTALLDDVTASKGVQATQDLSPATPTTGAAIFHPVQVAGMAQNDFVAIGTHLGAATSGGGISDCGAVGGTRWAVYVDGQAFLNYFCRQAYGSEPANAQNQHVEIIHTTCNGATQWTFKWNGAVKTCQTVNGAGGIPAVGGEAGWYNDPQTINVRDQALTYRVLGGTWTAWYASGTTACEYFASGYSYQDTRNSASDYSFYTQ